MFDVAIIGAGPAGCAAAITLARTGCRTLLIAGTAPSMAAHPRVETFSPGTLASLARVGVPLRAPDFAVTPAGYRSTWGDRHAQLRPTMLNPDLESVVVDRIAVDHLLRSTADRAGATLIQDFALEIKRERSKWTIKLCSDLASASFIIDASGRGSSFARRSGAKLICIDKLIAAVGLLEKNDADRDSTVQLESIQTGWVFTSLDVRGDRFVGYFTDGDIIAHRTADAERLSNAVGSCRQLGRYIAGRRPSHVHVVPAMTHFLADSGLPGLLCVGDAAQTYDPLSSQGAGHAISDAEAGSRALLRTLDGDRSALFERELARRASFSSYLDLRYAYYRAERRWTDEIFWQRRHDPARLSRDLRMIQQPRKELDDGRAQGSTG